IADRNQGPPRGARAVRGGLCEDGVADLLAVGDFAEPSCARFDLQHRASARWGIAEAQEAGDLPPAFSQFVGAGSAATVTVGFGDHCTSRPSRGTCSVTGTVPAGSGTFLRGFA